MARLRFQTMASKKSKIGPFGEVIFPEAEEEQRMDVMVRYRIRGSYQEVADFYRKKYDGVKHLCVAETLTDEQSNLSIGVSPVCEEVDFGALVVMPSPESKDGKDVWVLVMAR